MIRYTLRCPRDHSFESWFQSSAAYEALEARGAVGCPECGATGVERAPMAPRVVSESAPPEHPLARLRRTIEERSAYVADNFAAEARAIHNGQSDKTLIHGEATGQEARALLSEGVPILPLPFTPRRKLT